jgi:two-component sensor histidine kinase
MTDALDEFQRRVIRLAKFQKELYALAAMPDSEIDTSDIPETLDWRKAKRGPLKRD